MYCAPTVPDTVIGVVLGIVGAVGEKLIELNWLLGITGAWTSLKWILNWWNSLHKLEGSGFKGTLPGGVYSSM